jgi:hypothetical protein
MLVDERLTRRNRLLANAADAAVKIVRVHPLLAGEGFSLFWNDWRIQIFMLR